MTVKSLPYIRNIHKISPDDFAPLVEMALNEDAPNGDPSGEVYSGEKEVAAELIAKQDGRLCGLTVFDYVFESLGSVNWSERSASDGDGVKAGTLIRRFSGPAPVLLRAERTALNFLGLLSGICNTTLKIVQKLRAAEMAHYQVQSEGALPHKIAVLDTRKTIPGLRTLSKYAVYIGSGMNHRANLSEMAMIKENHIRSCGGIGQSVELLTQQFPDLPFEIEVTNLDEVAQIADLSKLPVAVLLDNMDTATIKEACKLLPESVVGEASGNYDYDNITSLVGTGVDAVSLGRITKAPEHFDFSLIFEKGSV